MKLCKQSMKYLNLCYHNINEANISTIIKLHNFFRCLFEYFYFMKSNNLVSKSRQSQILSLFRGLNTIIKKPAIFPFVLSSIKYTNEI